MTDVRSRRGARWCVLLLAAAARAGAQQQLSTFVNFESGHVRPLAFVDTATTDLLLAVNTPDNRLAVYTVTATSLALATEVPVGLEPVAVAARRRADGTVQAFVVNHLSDSVSVVTIDPAAPTAARVVRTLLVGDEPRDVVIAGPARDRVFVSTAHRGQNRPGNPQLTTQGIGRADVWAFDAENLGLPLGGTPLALVAFPGDTPRGLAASADGTRVYVAVFFSGNRTTVVPAPNVAGAGGLPPAPERKPLPEFESLRPDTGLIVRQEPATGAWQDELWRDWSTFVPFQLPDHDVFAIDAAAATPREAAAPNGVPDVGTVIFNLAVRPGSGAVYASNTEARNHVRFEPILRGHIAESRITVIRGGVATPVHLNPHILYDGHPGLTPGPDAQVEQSLAFPTDLAFSSDGATLYVAAFGSSKVGILDAAALEAGATTPRDLVLVGQGPSGLALDESRDRLYVMNRLDHTISVVTRVSDPVWRVVGDTIALPYSPEPARIRTGRRFLYDARLTSAHGDAACATCHVFGDFDGLAWDLGNPYGPEESDPNPNPGGIFAFHALKGPMTTQSLRGLDEAGPMHWRGDRTSAVDGLPGSHLDEFAAFEKFLPAFDGLLGRPLGDADMEKFAHFALTIRYPPNPVRALTNVPLPTDPEARGLTVFTRKGVDAGLSCDDCHALPLGTSTESTFDLEPQSFKVPHLRNLYQKVGRFGMPTIPGPLAFPGHDATHPIVRGFAYLHDGSVSTLDDFLRTPIFILSDQDRVDLVAFMLAFDTGLAPAVGQQVTVTAASVADATLDARITLLLARADAVPSDCDVVVRGRLGNAWRGWVHEPSMGAGLFQSDISSEPFVPEATLRGQAVTAGQERTYTCVPPGTGRRIGIDRDDDGTLDGDEALAGTPLDPPPDLTTTSTSTTSTSTTSSSTIGTIPPGLLEKLKHTRWTIPPFRIFDPGDPVPFFMDGPMH